jgi:hypothetical protein
MSPRAGLAIVRFGFAVLVLVAIGAQFQALADAGVLNPVNFFSYFTILSNLLGVAVFLVGAVRWRAAATPRWDLVRGQAVVVLTVTLVVFALLLAGTDVDVSIAWVNTVLHQVFPVVVIVDWLVDPPASAISWRRSMVWLAGPLVWTGYTMARGALTGWYPYPFLDPANGGYGAVFVAFVGILLFGAIVCTIVAAVGTALGSRRVIPLVTG